jgi:ABC-type phosphate transport system substrate-binding protein
MSIAARFMGLTIALAALVAATGAQANNFVVQGSTTFNRRIIIPYQPAIEAASSHKLTVIPNKSSIGIQALFEKRADFAMISGPLNDEIAILGSTNPNLSFDRLKVFPISTTRMSFAIHPNNRVRQVTTDKMKRVLLGEIVNWKELGGDDRPIRLVVVREGGGVQATVESTMMGGAKINPVDPIRVQISTQVLKIVEQEPGAIGLAQLSEVIQAKGTELLLDKPVTQTLSLVTLGDPTPEMRKLIDAAEHVATVNRD